MSIPGQTTPHKVTKTAGWLAGLSRSWHSDVVHLNQMAYPALAAFSAPTLVVVTVLAFWAVSGALGDAAPADIRFVVPAGTHDRIAAGEEVDIVPRVLEAEVGDVIEVVNEDDRTAQVGVFVVGPGQTVRQRFTSPGTLEGICEVHPDGVFTIEVTEPA